RPTIGGGSSMAFCSRSLDKFQTNCSSFIYWAISFSNLIVAQGALEINSFRTKNSYNFLSQSFP
ncbi:MAG: hypothetical protein J5757_06225, partial [Lachnospiraceae bacterium]|nr:hypothetical protein [Lachnospiraceae bacterium]